MEQDKGVKGEDECFLNEQENSGGVCETWALQAAVIPAKAGIQSAGLWKRAVRERDSRFRGNDGRFVG
jgi:hypothetical protein